MIKMYEMLHARRALEFELEEKSKEIGFEQVLDEIKATGAWGLNLEIGVLCLPTPCT